MDRLKQTKRKERTRRNDSFSFFWWDINFSIILLAYRPIIMRMLITWRSSYRRMIDELIDWLTALELVMNVWLMLDTILILQFANFKSGCVGESPYIVVAADSPSVNFVMRRVFWIMYYDLCHLNTSRLAHTNTMKTRRYTERIRSYTWSHDTEKEVELCWQVRRYIIFYSRWKNYRVYQGSNIGLDHVRTMLG